MLSLSWPFAALKALLAREADDRVEHILRALLDTNAKKRDAAEPTTANTGGGYCQRSDWQTLGGETQRFLRNGEIEDSSAGSGRQSCEEIARERNSRTSASRKSTRNKSAKSEMGESSKEEQG